MMWSLTVFVAGLATATVAQGRALQHTPRDIVYHNSTQYGNGQLGQAPNQGFRSASGKPPIPNIRTSPSSPDLLQDGYIFLGINNNLGDSGPLIYDNNGSIVYFAPQYDRTMHFRPQTYQGKPVLTFFDGSFFASGYGNGTNYIMDDSYNVIGNISCPNQPADTCDFHEVQITAEDTGLVESWRLAQADLSELGGQRNGWTFDCVVQEVDIANNSNLLFEWRSLDHVPISETYFGISANAGNSSTNPFDYCHVNSLTKDMLGNYIVSMRGPSTIYNISSSGEINWRLGGKFSNFTMGEGSNFYYQHHARLHDNDTRMTIFDNGGVEGAPAEATARAIELQLDTDNMNATLIRAYPAPFGNISGSQGSVQLLDNGNFLAGWGSEPYYTEFAEDGEVLLDVQFADIGGGQLNSYRAWKQVWYGNPTTQPNMSVETTQAGGLSMYVSWNGATNVSTWAAMGGASQDSLAPIVNASKTGFETVINATASGVSFVSVAALDATGACIGTSAVWSVGSNTPTNTNGTCPNGTGGTVGIGSAAVTASSDASGSMIGIAMSNVAMLGSAFMLLLV